MQRAALLVSAILLSLPLTTQAQDQSPAVGGAGQAAQPTASFSGSDENLTPAQLDDLVSRVALYPDDLLALVLPASTQPLQVVGAQRLLERKKSDPNVQPPKSWDPSVVALLNYPEVVSLMNDDLTWTQQLGTSVINQQSDLMDAVQRFRTKVYDAGNLKSDDKQKVEVQPASDGQSQSQTIIVQSADPEVVYVPSYNPTTIVYPPPPGYPPPYAYSPPYPYYYSPGAAFFTGAVFGAAVGFALSWGDNGIYHGDVNVNRNTNINVDNTNISNRMNNAQRTDLSNKVSRNGENAWHPDRNSVARDRERMGASGGTRIDSQQVRRDLQSRGGPQASVADRGGQNVSGARGPATPSSARAPDRQSAALSRGISPQGSGTPAARPATFSGSHDGAAASRHSARGNQSLHGGASRGGGAAARGGGGGGRRR